MKIKVGIVGATGYAGAELVRLLLSHPQAEVAAVSSVSFEGKKLSDVYPCFLHLCDDVLCDEDTLIEKSDIVFTSVPHGVGEAIAKKVIAAGKKFIDLGADFRLSKEADYKQWYGGEYHEPALHDMAVYGLPELFYKEIQGAQLVANPGCYPTSIALGLADIMETVHTSAGIKVQEIKIDGGVVAKFKVKDGAVVITRAYKSERKRSI